MKSQRKEAAAKPGCTVSPDDAQPTRRRSDRQREIILCNFSCSEMLPCRRKIIIRPRRSVIDTGLFQVLIRGASCVFLASNKISVFHSLHTHTYDMFRFRSACIFHTDQQSINLCHMAMTEVILIYFVFPSQKRTAGAPVCHFCSPTLSSLS